MGRNSRWTYNFVTLLSLALLLATGVLWIWSYRASWSHTAVMGGQRGPNGGIEDDTEMAWLIESDHGALHIEPIGSFYYWDEPYWKLAVLWLLLPARQLLRHPQLFSRRKGGTQGGLCAACGFDPRATPGRCPECGTVPPHEGRRSSLASVKRRGPSGDQ